MELGALLKGKRLIKVVAEFQGGLGSFAMRCLSNRFEGFAKI